MPNPSNSGLRFSLPGTGNTVTTAILATTTAPNGPERKPSGSRIREFMKNGSISRRSRKADGGNDGGPSSGHSPVSKDGIFHFGNGPSNVEFKVELDAGTEAQLQATRPPVNDSVISESQPYSLNYSVRSPGGVVRSLGGVAEDVYVPKLIEKIENNLNVIRGLHQRSLREFDSPVGASRTSPVSHELHYYGTRTRSLCLQLTRYFQTSGPRTTQQLERARNAQAIIKQYQNVISDSVGSIRVQMEEQYRLVRPEATDQDIAEALKDVPNRNVSVSYLRSIDEREAMQPIIRAIERRSRMVNVLEESLQELDELHGAIMRADGMNLTSDTPADVSSREIIIAPQGDVIMAFGSGKVFQVSSQILSAVSTLFSYALYPYRAGDRLHERGPPPADILMELPLAGPQIIDHSRPLLLRMPQHEDDEREALSVLFYAAHTQHDKVPRRIEFEDFVAIASVCHRYRCTAPVEIFVECFWLPQWQDKVGQGEYENFIFISYVFGLEAIFELTSKRVIVRSREEKGLFEGCDLPQNVWQRLNHSRAHHFREIVDRCNATINLYLPRARSSIINGSRTPNGGRTPRDSVSLLHSPSTEDEIQLVRPTRCPHGSYACDAANLGYLMMVMNEVGVLPPTWSNFAKRSEESLETWQGYSLHETLTKLCGAPSAPNVHDECDYAPAFRNSMCDIFNGIRGLSVRDVNERYANRRSSQLVGIGGPAADESRRRSVILAHQQGPTSNSPTPGPSAPIRGDDAVAAPRPDRPASTTPTPPPFHAYAGANLANSVLEDRRPSSVAEGVQRHTHAMLNARNLATMDMDLRSIVSTEIDTRTDRCVSPSVDSMTRSITPIPPLPSTGLDTDSSISLDSTSTSTSITLESPPSGVHDAREADKIFWTQYADKERITVADKNLLIAHKHILRIGEGRGPPPIQVPDLPSSPTSSSEAPTGATTPTQSTTSSSAQRLSQGDATSRLLRTGEDVEGTSTWI